MSANVSVETGFKNKFNNRQPWVAFNNYQSGVIGRKPLLHSISHGVKELKPKENYTVNQMCNILNYKLAATKDRKSLWSSPSLSVNKPNVNPARLEQDFDRESGYRSNPASSLPEDYGYLACLNLPSKEQSPKLNWYFHLIIVVTCDTDVDLMDLSESFTFLHQSLLAIITKYDLCCTKHC